MTINTARTLCNIAERAAAITGEYHATILDGAVLVTRTDEPSRSYIVRDGECTCPAFARYSCCKHSMGVIDLVEAEIVRLKRFVTLIDSGYARRAIEEGRAIAEAARCEMSVRVYRECVERAQLAA